MRPLARFKSVAIDVDSTLCGIEGIDWLAQSKGADPAAKVAELTRRAMDGTIALEDVYGERLSIVSPTREAVDALGSAYLRHVAPGALEAIRAMIAAGVEVHFISGGLIAAIRKVAEKVPLEPSHVHAVEIYFASDGSYLDYDRESPLATQRGKLRVLEQANLPAPALMVGDGMTDAEAREAVQAFAAFTGFVAREPVIERADHVVSTFHELLELVTL